MVGILAMPSKTWPLFWVLALSACTAYTPQALEPRPAPLPSRLLPLAVGLGEGEVVRSEAFKGITVQTDLATVFRRDLEANVFGPDDKRWGYAEFRLTFDGDAISGGGVALLTVNILTAFVPPLLGVPVTIRDRTLQAEIAIYNSHRVEVARYVVTGVAQYSTGIYIKEEYRRAGIDAAQSVMTEFRRRLAADVESVNDKLRTAGPVQ